MNSYVTPLVLSTAGIVCSTVAIAVYHCIILLRHFVRTHTAQRRDNTTCVKSEGIQQEILNKIKVFSISTTQTSSTGAIAIHLGQNIECSICLGQWEDYNVVRLLPLCNHVFHKSCVDAWFMDHANCPVCRSPITSDCELTLAMASQNGDA
ncbi:E3 ubiquitin-protein ligase [Vigna unguiculata]|uniref:E3 ubiquitin-protein ligase n=1 Tax=Vigna unguiculata TaxID=3917 RepID=A0A4D6M9L1_VIGUN|nr:E3 ubiquitin-protein ligase [Vigna unguiculata]